MTLIPVHDDQRNFSQSLDTLKQYTAYEWTNSLLIWEKRLNHCRLSTILYASVVQFHDYGAEWQNDLERHEAVDRCCWRNNYSDNFMMLAEYSALFPYNCSYNYKCSTSASLSTNISGNDIEIRITVLIHYEDLDVYSRYHATRDFDAT